MIKYESKYINMYREAIFKKCKNEFTDFFSLFFRKNYSDNGEYQYLYGTSLFCDKCKVQFKKDEKIINHDGYGYLLHTKCFEALKKSVENYHEEQKIKEIDLFWGIYFKKKAKYDKGWCR